MDTDREQPLATIPGRPPELAAMPVGCSFAARCGFADEQCRATRPRLVAEQGQRVACWHPRSAPAAAPEPGSAPAVESTTAGRER